MSAALVRLVRMGEGTAKPIKEERLDLVPPEPLLELSRAFARGADKYDAFGYLQDQAEYRRYLAAQMRHVLAWAAGEDIDPDSGIHHLSLAAANCFILQELQLRGQGIDDRLNQEVPVKKLR